LAAATKQSSPAVASAFAAGLLRFARNDGPSDPYS
jgi:hypothetical protein